MGRWILGMVLCAAGLTACGGGNSYSYSSPSPPAATLQSITVAPPPFTPVPLAGGIGLGRQMTATGMYSDGSTKDLTSTVTWTSTPTSVATVSGGVVTGVSVGMATITATMSGVSGNGSITITSNSWTPAAPITIAQLDAAITLAGPTATTLSDGTVLVQGYDGNRDTFGAALYSAVPDSWTSVVPTEFGTLGATATLLQNGKVLVVGGSNDQNALAFAEIYDPVAKAWSSAASMPTPREYHAAALLPDGRVLIVGGDEGGSSTAPPTTPLDAIIYDPNANAWSDAGPLLVASNLPTATTLPNGTVFVVNADFLGTTEIYDPAANTWSAGPTAGNPHWQGATATLLPDGKVLVVGGVASTTLNPITLSFPEIYDPNAGTWTPAGSMLTNRTLHTATLLPNGTVLVAGGTDSIGLDGGLASAELYDPGTNTWSSAGNMNASRAGAAAALLPGGEVLMVGGTGIGDDGPEVELYW